VIESKAGSWQKLKRWASRKRRFQRIIGVEAQYMDELNNLCLLETERRIKRLVAYMLPGWHLHRNPARTEPPLPIDGMARVRYPSGNEL
jgi:hypothetical protein